MRTTVTLNPLYAHVHSVWLVRVLVNVYQDMSRQRVSDERLSALFLAGLLAWVVVLGALLFFFGWKAALFTAAWNYPVRPDPRLVFLGHSPAARVPRGLFYKMLE